MEEQLTLEDWAKCCDMTRDRYGRNRKAPSWLAYERCENCLRWKMYPTEEQPPSGWGIVGWCNEHLQKVKSNSYCMNFEKEKL